MNLTSTHQSRRPRIFAATFVSEIAVGAHVGGVGALMVLLANDFNTPVATFAILSSFLGVGMVVFSLLSRWLLQATAGTILRLAAYLVVFGAIGLAFAPWIWLVIVCGLLVGCGTSLVILIVPAVLAGPRRARDIALANGASSAASIAAPLVYGFCDSLPGVPGRWAALMLALPAMYVLATIRHIDFVNTPSAFAERWEGRKGRARRKDLSDAFGPVSTVRAFGGAENVADDELARATLAHGATSVHVPDLGDYDSVSVGAVTDAAPSVMEDHIHPSHTPQEQVLTGLAGRRHLRIALNLLRVALSLVTEFSLYAWGVARLVENGVPTATAATLGAVFPLGMAAGRLSAGLLIRWRYVFVASIAASIVGTLMIGLGLHLPQIIAGLVIAGMGNALLYPITVDDLVAIDGLSPNRAAALCSLGGGVTVFVMPLILPLVGHYLSLAHSLLLLCPIALILYFIPTGRSSVHDNDEFVEEITARA
ncbi:MFS transporter [Actinomyces vulturis]|uniref:MFS transporter n=1 Tax=Actinomyces vulturis TaxID=1857645 RepID=UPI00082D3A71|nr:MFS transporter [Actinomyces vulturis]